MCGKARVSPHIHGEIVITPTKFRSERGGEDSNFLRFISSLLLLALSRRYSVRVVHHQQPPFRISNKLGYEFSRGELLPA